MYSNNNLKTFCGSLLIALAACMASCTDAKKEVKTFAADFATLVSHNQKDSLLAVWPDVAKADSLALAFNADSIMVEETETPGTFKVKLGPDAEMTVTRAEDGKMTVKETSGLFAWPDEKVSMALATGWITKDLNDMQKQKRFADTLFVNSLADKLMAGLKSKLRASCKVASTNMSEYVCTYAILVQNDNDFDIPADAYSLVMTEWGWDCERLKDVPGKTRILDGIMLKANSSERCPAPGKYDLEYGFIRVAVKINYNKEQVVNKLLKPTGNEYEEYLKSKEKDND